jgi:SEL1 protein
MRGGNRGEDDVNEFGETMLLILLCLGLSVLLYVRTRLVERMRRNQQQPEDQLQQQRPDQLAPQEQQPPPPPADLGLFPPADDPARDEWAIVR